MTIQRKPFHVNVIAPAFPAFQQASQLCREGYIFAPDMPVEITTTGQAIFTMILGTPDQNAINAAKETTEHGLAMEAAQYKRDVEASAKLMLEDYKKEQLQKQVDAEIAEHKRKIAEIEKAAQTAASRLK